MSYVQKSYVFLLIILASCTSSKEMKEKSSTTIPLIPEIIGSTVTKQLVSPDKADTAESSWEYEFYAVPKSAFQDSVNHKIGSFVWLFTDYGENPYTYQPLSHQYFADRLDVFAKTWEEVETDPEFRMLWDVTGESTIIDNLKDYVQLQQSAYIYTGGAHPNSTNISDLISKADGKTLLLEDIVTDLPRFTKIAEKHFRIAREIAPDASLADEYTFENGVFYCNDNFSISPEGISFYYNPYEIASYAQGPTEFTIPLNEVKHLLKIELAFK